MTKRKYLNAASSSGCDCFQAAVGLLLFGNERGGDNEREYLLVGKIS